MSIATTNLFSLAVLLVSLGFATWVDLNEHRIPNGIVLYGLIVGLAMALLAGGSAGIGDAVLGSLIGGTLLLPYYVLGGLGAGDVKLMAMAGAFLGAKLAVAAVMLTLLSGVVIGVAVLVIWRLARSSSIYGRLQAIRSNQPVSDSGGASIGARPALPKFPYALAILSGVTGALVWHFTSVPGVLT